MKYSISREQQYWQCMVVYKSLKWIVGNSQWPVYHVWVKVAGKASGDIDGA